MILDKKTKLNRRDFLKSASVASAAMAIGLNVPTLQAKAKSAESNWKWDKAPCRFCGTGCGIMIATVDDKIVAIKGDVEHPVNEGLNCIKGYFNAKIMYAEDRMKKPLLRVNEKGEFDKKGKFAEVSWKRAMDEMEKHFRKAYDELGPTGVAFMTSGQHTIMEGYASLKLMKAGFRGNNIDPNARHCMASAVVAFMQTFGIDEPSGCYDDIEITDTYVTWGANMAEMHPVLWSRISDRKLREDEKVKIINLSTYSNRTSNIADIEIIFKPSSDLAIMNYIARSIVFDNPASMDWDFINKYCSFATGYADIGYGMRENPEHKSFNANEKDTVAKQVKKTLSKAEGVTLQHLDLKAGDTMENKHAKQASKFWGISFEDFKKGVAPYTLDFVAQIAKGDDNESIESFKEKLIALANVYIEKGRKVMSFWTMGFNQHQRGVWVNEQAYMIHFLVGKQGTPGNCAFSLTGQPSACGTAREVGTFCHRLPSDMTVTNPKHIAIAEKEWNLPTGTLNTVVGSHFTKMMRDLEDSKIKFVWVQVTNPWQNTANANHWIKAARELDNFIVVSEVYPGITAKVGDLILPTAMIYEKWGAYGNAERRSQHWKQQVTPVGDAMSDTWQLVEFSKRFKISDFWGREYPELKLKNVMAEAKAKGYDENTTLFDALFANKRARSYKVDKEFENNLNSEVSGDKRKIIGTDGKVFKGYNFFIQKYLWEEYAAFGRGHGHDLDDFNRYHSVRGLRWPVVEGKETLWRFNAKYDPYALKLGEGQDIAFYGNKDKKMDFGDLKSPSDKKVSINNRALIFFRPYMDPVEMPDKKYPYWLSTGRVLEHWHSGTMTMRVPELFKSVPESLCYMNEIDAQKIGINEYEVVWIESRRGKVKARVEFQGRNKPPVGLVYVPWFDENVFINKVCLDSYDPLSFQTDFKKCAVNIYKA